MAYRFRDGGRLVYVESRNDSDTTTCAAAGGVEVDVLTEYGEAAPVGVAGCKSILVVCRNANAAATPSKLTFKIYGAVKSDPTPAPAISFWKELHTIANQDEGEWEEWESNDNKWPLLKVTAQETDGVNAGEAEVYIYGYTC